MTLPFDYHAFPLINASLNAASAVFLLAAYVLIKQRRFRAHGWMMGGAVLTSAVFLACYLTYHGIKASRGEGVTHFPPSAWRPIYMTILSTHTLLAVVILPMIFLSLLRAYRREWPRHTRIATPTFFLWLYVSVTGVVVYFMLYHLAPTLVVATASAGL